MASSAGKKLSVSTPVFVLFPRAKMVLATIIRLTLLLTNEHVQRYSAPLLTALSSQAVRVVGLATDDGLLDQS